MDSGLVALIISGLFGGGGIVAWMKVKNQKETAFNQQIFGLMEYWKKEFNSLVLKHEYCEYETSMLRFIIKRFEKMFGSIEPVDVYILDDNPTVTMAFKYQLGKYSILRPVTFNNAKTFVNEVQLQKPHIIVVDNMLGEELVAADIITKLNYSPEIIIISADITIEQDLIAKGVKFFYKDQHYIVRVANACVDYLNKEINEK